MLDTILELAIDAAAEIAEAAITKKFEKKKERRNGNEDQEDNF